MRMLTLATLGIVTLVLCTLATPASAADQFCFKDQRNRVYGLYVMSSAGPMVSISGIATQVLQSGIFITHILNGAAYQTGLTFAFASLIKFKPHRDEPVQGVESAISMRLESPSYTSGTGTEVLVDGTQIPLAFTPADCVNPQ